MFCPAKLAVARRSASASATSLYRLLRTIDDHQVEVLITLATVVGGYALAHALHVSGPLAMVAIGLIDRQRRPRAGDVGARPGITSTCSGR